MSINTTLANVQPHQKTHPHTDHSFTGTSILVGANGAGTAAEIDYAEAATATTIPIRDSNGDMLVPAIPTNDAAAAAKKWVENLLDGARDPKESVRVATTAALPANTAAGSGVGKTLTMDAVGILTINGVSTVLNDRVLVKDEAAGANNGIYKVTTEGTAGVAAALTRATDADGSATGKVSAGMYVWADQGTTNKDRRFVLSTDDPITLDTTALTFINESGLGLVTAGDALSKSGDTMNWVPDGTTLEVSADQGRIKDLGVSTEKLAAAAVTTAKIAANAVTAAELATDAVTSAKILAGAVGTSEIATDAVTAVEIAAGAVGTTEIAADAVTAAKIAADAVGTTEIAALAVTAAEIAAGAVGISELADQKAEITLAGATPILTDLSALTADGHWALGKGTDTSAWLCTMVGTKKFSVQLGEVTS